MTLDELKKSIAEDLQLTKELLEFMEKHIKPALSSHGVKHCEDMESFYTGYEYALDKVRRRLALVNNEI